MQPRANPYRRAGERFAKTLSLKGVQLAVLKAGTEGEIDAAFASLVQLQAGALVDPDGFLSSRREQLVAPASRQAVPAIYAHRRRPFHPTHRRGVDADRAVNGGAAGAPVTCPETFSAYLRKPGQARK
jgi:hypothetical protein